MNHNMPLLTWLMALILSLSAFLNAFFVFQQVMLYKDLETLNNEIVKGPQLQILTQNIVNDLVAYGQKQPAIHPLLQKYGVKLPAPPTSVQKPTPSIPSTPPYGKHP